MIKFALFHTTTRVRLKYFVIDFWKHFSEEGFLFNGEGGGGGYSTMGDLIFSWVMRATGATCLDAEGG